MKTVTISQEEYDKLIRDQKILNALYAGGVNNWEWYSDSLQEIWDSDSEE